MEAFKEIKRNDWTLVYNPEFEQYRERYKNIISVVKDVIEGGVVEGLEVKKIGECDDRKYYVLNIEDEEFFIKKSDNYNQGGVDEFKSGKEIEDRLAVSSLDKVKTIEYLFAYTDNNVRYSVSRYDKNAENVLYKYMAQLRIYKKYNEHSELEKRLEKIQLEFSDYGDLRSGNMGYNPETGEIILFDLNTKNNYLVESSDDEL